MASNIFKEEGMMTQTLPEIKFWKDESKEIVNPELFSDVADKWAKVIKDAGGRNENKISQIRKFYDEVLFFSAKIKNEQEFEKMFPYIKMLNAKAFYAEGRGHVTEEFKEFILKCIKQIKNKKDFDVFVKFFEAFMGYYRYYDEKIKSTGGKHEAKRN